MTTCWVSNMWIQATQKQLAQLDLTKYSRKVVEGKFVFDWVSSWCYITLCQVALTEQVECSCSRSFSKYTYGTNKPNKRHELLLNSTWSSFSYCTRMCCVPVINQAFSKNALLLWLSQTQQRRTSTAYKQCLHYTCP